MKALIRIVLAVACLGPLAVFILAARLFIGLAPRSVVEEHVRLIDEGV